MDRIKLLEIGFESDPVIGIPIPEVVGKHMKREDIHTCILCLAIGAVHDTYYYVVALDNEPYFLPLFMYEKIFVVGRILIHEDIISIKEARAIIKLAFNKIENVTGMYSTSINCNKEDIIEVLPELSQKTVFDINRIKSARK